jgi:CRISPR-associated protein Cmr5
MHNLDQIRAAAAIKDAKDLKRSAIAKLPSLILTNGLLSAAAFADAEGGGDNKDHLKRAMQSTAKHLASSDLAPANSGDIQTLIQGLTQRDSLNLQRATAEALAYLSYLKRFSQKDA